MQITKQIRNNWGGTHTQKGEKQTSLKRRRSSRIISSVCIQQKIGGGALIMKIGLARWQVAKLLNANGAAGTI
jgi:hypothetical protein